MNMNSPLTVAPPQVVSAVFTKKYLHDDYRTLVQSDVNLEIKIWVRGLCKKWVFDKFHQTP